MCEACRIGRVLGAYPRHPPPLRDKSTSRTDGIAIVSAPPPDCAGIKILTNPKRWRRAAAAL